MGAMTFRTNSGSSLVLRPKTGLVKNMAMMEGITINMNSQIPIIESYLIGKITTLESANKKRLHQYVKVFLNGNWLGVTRNIIKIHNDLRAMRFRGELSRMVGLVLNYKTAEFHIYTDGGRLIRPYLTVTDNKLNFKPEMLDEVNSWEEFLAKFPEVIEYVDKEEEQNIMLAVFPQYIQDANRIMSKKPINSRDQLNKINRTNRYDDNVYVRYTHCEIHPCMILGLISSNIPFPDHNQSPRGIFQYNQARQAMGLYISDYRERTDISYILYHPQIPLVTSRASKYTGTHIFPAGENSIVAIASYTGYNQEDSLVINDSAIQKGYMRAQALKKYMEIIKKNPASSQTSIFMKPDRNKVDNLRDANYDKLSEEGYAKVETVIRDGDVVIGMVNPKPTAREDEKQYKDASSIYKSLIPGAVDKVITEVNNDGYPIIKMRIRSERIPNVGDKFSSRAGQKGTIGYKAHRADMLFSKSGLIPDIIINPNCMPKRMTIGQLIECLLGKLCAVKGVYGDATPFTSVDLNAINDELVAAGYEEWGNETMYNGMNGKKLPVKIFIGPTYYQRLKQMVGDKAHCLSLDHEVLTLDGWKFNHQLDMNDKIATLVDEKLVYQKPIKILNYPKYNGDMYHIKTQQLDLLVTSNHRMWVSKRYGRNNKWLDYDFELAEDIIGKRRKYKKDAIWNTEDYQFVLPKTDCENGTTYPEKKVDMDSWLIFFGIWIAEGWTTSTNDKRWLNSKSHRVEICQCKQRVIDKLIPAITKLGYHYRQYNDKFIINNKQLYMYMKQYSVGASNKYLPNWVWCLSSRQSRILLEGMVLGDGSYHGSSIVYYTSSIKLADNVMQLALHCGWSSNKWLHSKAGNETVIEGRNVKSNHDVWRLAIIKSKNNPEVNHGHQKSQNGQTEEIIKNYNKPVFCLQVPGGVFYVRRNGKPVWTGNSRARGPTQLLTRRNACLSYVKNIASLQVRRRYIQIAGITSR